jgi:hypothetical protein
VFRSCRTPLRFDLLVGQARGGVFSTCIDLESFDWSPLTDILVSGSDRFKRLETQIKYEFISTKPLSDTLIDLFEDFFYCRSFIVIKILEVTEQALAINSQKGITPLNNCLCRDRRPPAGDGVVLNLVSRFAPRS